jgi:hypothetical protein
MADDGQQLQHTDELLERVTGRSWQFGTLPAPGAVWLLPLYQPVPLTATPSPGGYVADIKDSGYWTGNAGVGQSAWFNITGFAGVVISDNSGGLNVQPAAISDPTFIIGTQDLRGRRPAPPP